MNSTSKLIKSQKDIYVDFWSEFVPKFQVAYPGWSKATKPSYNWMSFPSGRHELSYLVGFFGKRGQPKDFRVDIYIDAIDAEDPPDMLRKLEENRSEIEKLFGNSLQWNEVPEHRHCRISYSILEFVDVIDSEFRSDLITLALIFLRRLQAAFSPYIDKLR